MPPRAAHLEPEPPGEHPSDLATRLLHSGAHERNFRTPGQVLEISKHNAPATISVWDHHCDLHLCKYLYVGLPGQYLQCCVSMRPEDAGFQTHGGSTFVIVLMELSEGLDSAHQGCFVQQEAPEVGGAGGAAGRGTDSAAKRLGLRGGKPVVGGA